MAGLPQNDVSVRETLRYLKVTKAQYHIFHRQWLEAEQSLAGLPLDDDSIRDTHRNLIEYRRERIGSAVLDLGMNIIPRIVPDAYKETAVFDISQTTVHVATSGPFKKLWFPFVLRTAGDTIPRDFSFRSIATVILDIADCVFRQKPSLRNYQKGEIFTSCAFRTIDTTWTFFSNPMHRSPPSAMSFLSLLVSLKQTSDAYREIRQPPVQDASLSTIQLIASDFALGALLVSYSDLLPVIVGDQAKSLTARISSFSSQETEENSKDKWIAAALAVGSLTVYRLYRDYPCLWAASVMREVEFYFSQGEYDDAQRVLTEAESAYFVSSARPVVRNYARYLNWLKDHPQFLEDPNTTQEFFMQVDLVLNILKRSSYYRVIRNNLLLKKLGIAIKRLDSEKADEVLKEKPEDRIVASGFQLLLNNTLQNPAAACAFLQKTRPSFPSSFHPIVSEYLQFLQVHSELLQDISRISFHTELEKGSEKITQWNTVIEELQSFFSKTEKDTGVYPDLQYYKLIIAFIQENNTQQTDSLFKVSAPELHQLFSHGLVQSARSLLRGGDRLTANKMLKKVNFSALKENELIQHYGHFFSLVYSLPLQWNHAFEMIRLDRCITLLDPRIAFHQEMRVFFSACRVVLSLDAGEQVIAQGLLSQVALDSGISDEVAALLFERIYLSMKDKGKKTPIELQKIVEKAINDLQSIIEALGQWQHLALFRSFQVYLASESNEVQLEHLESVISHLMLIRLSDFIVDLQFRKQLLQFKILLSRKEFTAAKTLLDPELPNKLYTDLCNSLFIFFINQGQHLYLTGSPLREVREKLRKWNDLFDSANARMIQSYIDFLASFENAKQKKRFHSLQTGI